jgi:hypothetical protein
MEAMDSSAVAADVLDALGSAGPMIVPGEGNRAIAANLWPTDRTLLIQGMAISVSALYDVPRLSAPTYS